jgi:agmatinase
LENKSLEEFFVKPKNPFADVQVDFKNSDYVVLGFPFDATSTYRFGSKKAPEAVREASLNIETYSFRSDLYIEDLKICDLGNLIIVDDFNQNFLNLKNVLSKIFSLRKFPVVLGGEHTLTYSVAEAFPEKFGIISFDAHLDLRDEYLGKRFSHTTFMRRIIEKNGGERVFFVGTRAVCKEELEYTKKEKIGFLTSLQVKTQNIKETLKTLRNFASSFSGVYLTVDIDVLDPAYAPAASNPEPEGLDPTTLTSILVGLGNTLNIIGLDVVEFTPKYDFGVTAILAAKIIFEVLCSTEKRRKTLFKPKF